MAEWYPEGWHPTDGEPYEPGGVRVVLDGGPLDGRTAHVIDRDTSLWIATNAKEAIIVTDGKKPPELPNGARLLGRYVFDAEREALIWSAQDITS